MESWSTEVVKRVIVKCAGILDYSELRLKAGQTYLPSGHGGMRVQPAGVYIERIPQSHK